MNNSRIIVPLNFPTARSTAAVFVGGIDTSTSPRSTPKSWSQNGELDQFTLYPFSLIINQAVSPSIVGYYPYKKWMINGLTHSHMCRCDPAARLISQPSPERWLVQIRSCFQLRARPMVLPGVSSHQPLPISYQVLPASRSQEPATTELSGWCKGSRPWRMASQLPRYRTPTLWCSACHHHAGPAPGKSGGSGTLQKKHGGLLWVCAKIR